MGKYDKYICTTLEKKHMLPGPNAEQRDKLAAEGKRLPMENLLWIDADVIPGAYYGEVVWMWPPEFPGQTSWAQLEKEEGISLPMMFPHAHNFPELLCWWGTNPDDPADADSMAIQIGDEIIDLPSSWIAYSPADVPHMPVFNDGSGSQIFAKPSVHWTFGPGGVYVMGTAEGEYNEEDAEMGHQKEAEPAPEFMEAHRVTDPAASKYAHFVVFGTPEDVKRPDYMRPLDPKFQKPMGYIDETIMPDAELGCETQWILPGSTEDIVLFDEHTLPYATSLSLAAYNYEDLYDLCAEAELYIGGEKHTLDKLFWAHIPPNVSQGPLIIRNVKKQVFFLRCWPQGEGIKKYPNGD